MSFDKNTIDAVWEKAKTPIIGEEKVWRKDFAGAWIKKDEYGNQNSSYGWEIDHKKPVSLNGSDEVSNLAPMHWENNRSKADYYPDFKTVVTSDGNRNIYQDQFWNY